MGYRINISNANSVGHLIEGNIISFLNQTLLDENYLEGNLGYIDDILSNENSDFISSNPGRFLSSKSLLRENWDDIKTSIRGGYYENERSAGRKDGLYFNGRNKVLNYLSDLSRLLGKYQIKFLVLPGFEDNAFNNSLVSKRELVDWLQAKANFSYLIIQLKEIPKKDDIQILNSFKHFTTAIQRIDEWPGLLVWQSGFGNRTAGLFIPIASLEELKLIVEAQYYEKHYFNFLLSEYGYKKTINNSQLLHLSDLHLGLKNETIKVNRLLNILGKHRRETTTETEIYPLISGDLVENPSSENVTKFEYFKSQLNMIGFEEPITVLGNHDNHVSGIIRGDNALKNVIGSLSSQDHLVIIEPLKLVIIKFDSNTDGHLAQGKIGTHQLTTIGNQLDRIEDLNEYCLIGMLHHHPFELIRPDWIKRAWYEKIVGDVFMNESLKLLDSELFIQWVNRRNIKYVIHGHKHIPMLFKKDNVNIISAGSSTGNIKHINSNKTFLTYNVINYDKDRKKPVYF
ncbi:MAG: hypothetical protein JWQ09_5337 [Segetibacter sp.]|nr:hypothetical protein [Segetibacter sp.]